MPTSLYPRLATGIALMLLAVASAVALPSPLTRQAETFV